MIVHTAQAQTLGACFEVVLVDDASCDGSSAIIQVGVGVWGLGFGVWGWGLGV